MPRDEIASAGYAGAPALQREASPLAPMRLRRVSHIAAARLKNDMFCFLDAGALESGAALIPLVTRRGLDWRDLGERADLPEGEETVVPRGRIGFVMSVQPSGFQALDLLSLTPARRRDGRIWEGCISGRCYEIEAAQTGEGQHFLWRERASLRGRSPALPFRSALFGGLIAAMADAERALGGPLALV